MKAGNSNTISLLIFVLLDYTKLTVGEDEFNQKLNNNWSEKKKSSIIFLLIMIIRVGRYGWFCWSPCLWISCKKLFLSARVISLHDVLISNFQNAKRLRNMTTRPKLKKFSHSYVNSCCQSSGGNSSVFADWRTKILQMLLPTVHHHAYFGSKDG